MEIKKNPQNQTINRVYVCSEAGVQGTAATQASKTAN